MKLYVERCGSEFGGYYGKYIIDLKTNCYLKIDDASNKSTCGVKVDEEWLLGFNSIVCTEKLKQDYLDLTYLLNAKLVKTPVSFDGQIDKVVVIEDESIRLIHSPCDIPFICVEDDKIRNKILGLINEVSNVEPEIDKGITISPIVSTIVLEEDVAVELYKCCSADASLMHCHHATGKGVEELAKLISENLGEEKHHE